MFEIETYFKFPYCSISPTFQHQRSTCLDSHMNFIFYYRSWNKKKSNTYGNDKVITFMYKNALSFMQSVEFFQKLNCYTNIKFLKWISFISDYKYVRHVDKSSSGWHDFETIKIRSKNKIIQFFNWYVILDYCQVSIVSTWHIKLCNKEYFTIPVNHFRTLFVPPSILIPIQKRWKCKARSKIWFTIFN